MTTITSEDREALLALVEQLQTQHNDYTSYPIFLVQKKVVTSGFDTQYTDDIRWVDSDGEFADSQEHARLEAGYEASLDEPDGWTRTGVQETWETAQTFLTRKAAEQYLKSNKHRLGEGARVYTDSAYRNHETQMLQRTLPLLVGMLLALSGEAPAAPAAAGPEETP